jgi:flagellar basal-body rod protein FlgB
MTQPLEALTTAALSAAMDLASARHAAIASNIANAHTEGYVPLRVDFAAHLADARATLSERGRLELRDLEALRSPPPMEPAEGGGDPRVQLDVEMTQLARNAVQFQALAQALSRHLGLLSMAAADGKR